MCQDCNDYSRPHLGKYCVHDPCEDNQVRDLNGYCEDCPASTVPNNELTRCIGMNEPIPVLQDDIVPVYEDPSFEVPT